MNEELKGKVTTYIKRNYSPERQARLLQCMDLYGDNVVAELASPGGEEGQGQGATIAPSPNSKEVQA